MAASSSSSAAADPRPPKHDVFLSFRGEDTREKFTSHLKDALSRKQIEAYKDDVNLKIGDAITPALREAIEKSEISIVIFSDNYASSSWCLDELVHILKCKKEKARIVLPIFIDIDPSHIRKQEGSYATAFEKHEKRFRKEKVRQWRQALSEAAGLSGCVSTGKSSESEIVQKVVERVRIELDAIKSKRSGDFKGLFGIAERVEKIKSFLDSPTVRIIGIWGMGGIGKTSLAEVVFKRFYNDFEGSCFAPNVRENAINKGLDALKTEVFSKLLGETNLDIFKSSAVDERLSRTKALLVLDDVNDPMQFEDLVGDPYRFCQGSKIIVTSRDKLKVDEEYKVEELDSKDACKLFYLKAFGHESCRRGFERISDRVVEYTKCLPLALKVLGASVFYFLKSIEDWEKELKKLERIRNEKIQKVLEISYDGLDAEQKGLFLDIACFFKGKRRDFVEGILEDKPIAGLVNKSLITIEDGRIHMHDLIQEMGRDIVLRSTQHSRLWIGKDVSDALENNKGTEAIEGIYLPWIKEDDVHLRPDVFKEMRKLRLLKFYDPSHYYLWYGKVKVYIDGDLKYLPNGLRYLHWEYYPGKSLPSNFKPQNLVELHMPNSKLEQLWDGVQELWSLKHINLLKSKLLTKIPDLSRAPKLKSINLSSCESLIHIPSLNLNIQATMDESTHRHQWLSVELDYSEFEDERTPGCIILSSCKSLTTLPKVGGNIRKLVLSGTALKELPSSIESLENLLHLNLRKCYKLNSLPKLPRNIEVLILDYSGIKQILSSSIECLCSLRKLSLSYCQSLSSLQFNINFKALEELEIIGTSIQELPPSIEMLYKLKKLDMRKCKNLQSLPASIGMLYNLKKLEISNCKNLQSLPASIGMLNKLKKLDISNCENLQSLPASIGMLYKLKKLDIRNCKSLQSLPELPLFIESINANNCFSLEKVSTSRSTLTLGRWLDKYDSDCDSDWLDEYGSDRDSDGDRDRDHFGREFSFLNCTKLGEDAINNIFREFLYKVFCTATTPPEVVHSKRVISELVVCYPKEILRWFNNQSGLKKFEWFMGDDNYRLISHIRRPFNYQSVWLESDNNISHIRRWFDYQSEGSSITISLPPNWYNPKTFLGFVVSVIVVFGNKDTIGTFDPLKCELHLKTICGESLGEVVFRYATFYGDSESNFNKNAPCSEHIVVWYKYFDHSKENFEKCQEASFEVKTANYECIKVKRCGVRMLYLKDAVEESNDDDGSTASFESWRTNVIDSDTDYATTYDSDEPPHKRTRNL